MKLEESAGSSRVHITREGEVIPWNSEGSAVCPPLDRASCLGPAPSSRPGSPCRGSPSAAPAPCDRRQHQHPSRASGPPRQHQHPPPRVGRAAAPAPARPLPAWAGPPRQHQQLGRGRWGGGRGRAPGAAARQGALADVVGARAGHLRPRPHQHQRHAHAPAPAPASRARASTGTGIAPGYVDVAAGCVVDVCVRRAPACWQSPRSRSHPASWWARSAPRPRCATQRTAIRALPTQDWFHSAP